MFALRNKMRRTTAFGKKGFTLVELMVVVAIIAILAAIIIPVASRSREAARQTACKSNMHAIAIALRNYLNDEGGFPLPYNAYSGTGGVSQLYLSGYISSTSALRCPDDSTSLADYNAAHATFPSWSDWNQDRFDERYSTYNEILFADEAYPLYNYYGYRGFDGSSSGTVMGTGPNRIEIAGLGNGWIEWIGVVYRDAAHTTSGADGHYLKLATDDEGRIYDRKDPAGNQYARPLLDNTTDNTTASSPGITAYFPGLINRNAPDNTIITHCPHHRVYFGSGAAEKDLIVRLSGDTGNELVNSYDWVVQKAK